MKDIEWLKNNLKMLVSINNMDSSSFSATKREAYSDALDLIEQLDDSEVSLQVSPVIPRFVADFLTGKEDYSISDLFNYNFLYDANDKIAKWLYDNDEETNKERELSLVLAHYGEYTVEEEQKYYVLLPEIVDHWRYVSLAPNHWGVTVRYTDTLDDVHEFTEQEIKDYDERYWPFAVKVEEMEE